MLRRNMLSSLDSQLKLEDLLADLHFARRTDKLGRLALLAYCDCKGWARCAGKSDVADKALDMFTENPCRSKEEFLERVDHLIAVLERHHAAYQHDGAYPAVRAAPAVYPAAHP